MGAKIDQCKTLNDLTVFRQQQYDMDIAAGENYEDILVRIYEKPTHFVYELLQNADDAKAKTVKFELKDDELLFYHDGTKDFSIKDIISITGIGNSSKKDDEKTVGKFGVGFKSVFSVTNMPKIYNRAYNFRIVSMKIPFEIPPRELGEYTTIFELPFKSEKYTNAQIVKRIKNEFNVVDCRTLMFLKNVREIKLKYGSKERSVQLERSWKRAGYELISDLESGDRYMRFCGGINDASSIVFALSEDGDEIVNLDDECVYSFLPTKTMSGLAFMIDAPFMLATTRESIDFDDEFNRKVLNGFKGVLYNALKVLSNEGFVDEDFFEYIMPIDSEMREREDFEVYSFFYDSFVEIAKQLSIFPTTDGKKIRARSGFIYDAKGMVELAKFEKPWLDLSYSGICRFLETELNVTRVSCSDFIYRIAPKLKDKDDKYLHTFYSMCTGYEWDTLDSVDALQHAPIIKTRAGSFRAAYDKNDNELVFRPSKGLKKSQIVHNLFVSTSLPDELDTKMREFLAIAGIKERSPSQIIQMTVLSKWGKATVSERKRLFREIWRIYNEVKDYDDRRAIENMLNEHKIFYVEKGEKKSWCFGKDAMVGSKEQRLLFGDRFDMLVKGIYNDGYTVDEKTGEKMETGNQTFCRNLGVNFGLPIEMDYEGSCFNDKRVSNELLKENQVYDTINDRWWISESYYISDFDDVISGVSSAEMTKAIVELLANTDKDLLYDRISGTSSGGRVEHTFKMIPATYIRLLNDRAWIYADGKRKKTTAISRKRFVATYGLDGTEPFLELLKFKPSAYEDLSNEDQRYLKMLGQMSEAKREEALRYIEHLSLEEEVQGRTDETERIEEDFPALNDKLMLIDAEKLRPIKNEFTMSDVVIVKEPKRGTKDSGNDKPKDKPTNSKMSSDFKNRLGKKGEKAVRHFLAENYDQYEYNLKGGKNAGFDIEVKNGNEIIKYIDVKTSSSGGTSFEVSTTQWRVAREYREKYSFFLLNALNGKCVEVNDPYGKYIEGLLEIDVSGIEISDVLS